MKRLTTSQIRTRTLEIIKAAGRSISKKEITYQIELEAPLTHVATISTQVSQAASDKRVDSVGHGVYLWIDNKHEELGQPSDTESAREIDTPQPIRTFASTSHQAPTLKEKPYDFLMRIGFVLCGKWMPGTNPKLELVDHQDLSPCVYAFLVGEECVYIGRSERTLELRMLGYAKPGPTQSTNIRISRLIRIALDEGHTVRIATHGELPTMQILGLELDMAAALEKPLIRRLVPTWNVSR